MIPKLSTMTPEAKRVAIAMVCDLKPYLDCCEHGEYSPLSVLDFLVIGGCCRWCGNDLTLKDCPAYLTSLDACHEFEQTLTDEEQEQFAILLYRALLDLPASAGVHWSDIGSMPKIVSATAAQRADAFLIAKQLATL